MKQNNINSAKTIIRDVHDRVELYLFSEEPIIYSKGDFYFRSDLSNGCIAEILYAYRHGEYFPDKLSENELLRDISQYLGTRSYNLFRIEKWPAKKRKEYNQASDTKKQAEIICEMIDYYTNWHKKLDDIPYDYITV